MKKNKMQYKKNKVFIWSLFFCCLIIFSSCEKLIEIPAPTNLVSGQDLFKSEALADAAVANIYVSLNNNYRISIFSSLSADDLIYNGTDDNCRQFNDNDLLTSNIYVSYIWRETYQAMLVINRCVTGLRTTTTIPEAKRKQLLGEALFARSFTYFYFNQLYGGVPLVLDAKDYQTTALLPRVSTDQITKQITTDLLEAKGLLNSTYVGGTPIRSNKWAASALLAKIYLYQKDWENAEINSSDVINSNIYNLTPDPGDAFSVDNQEAIWQLAMIDDGVNTYEAGIFLPYAPDVIPDFAISSSLLNAFEVGDKRKVAWLGNNTVGKQTYYYPNKYKIAPYASNTVTERSTLLRLAEQYLIRAEARAMQNILPGAISDLDLVRNRAGLTTITNTKPSINQSDLLKSIVQENRIEFFCEWSHRWFDLRRLGASNAVMSLFKPKFQESDLLWPIPQSQITANPNLIQNLGY